MKVIVAGAGALGSLLGGYLAHAGEQVLLLGRESHVEAIRQNHGLRISGLPGDILVPVRAATRVTESDGPADLVILGAKSQDVQEVLDLVGPVVGPQTQILSPQNGVAAEEFVSAAYGADRSLAAVTGLNVRVQEPGHLFHGAGKQLDLGAMGQQDIADVERVVSAFNRAGLVTSARDDIRQLKWRKMAIFCNGSIVNALTGAQRLDEGADLSELMHDLAEEMIAVVEAGHLTPFPIRPLVEDAFHHWESFRPAGTWLASVGQDLRKGKRRTEVDFLNGHIVRLGRQYGVRTPVHHCIYTLVKSIEATGYLERQPEAENVVSQRRPG
jgi:2-dehydropantoate 2-reductase